MIRDDLDDLIRVESERDPGFGGRLRGAEAELHLVNDTAERRHAEGLTQRQLAQQMGVAPALIGRFEQAGRTPSVTTLWKFATALDVTYEIAPDYGVHVVKSGIPSIAMPYLISDWLRFFERQGHSVVHADRDGMIRLRVAPPDGEFLIAFESNMAVAVRRWYSFDARLEAAIAELQLYGRDGAGNPPTADMVRLHMSGKQRCCGWEIACTPAGFAAVADDAIEDDDRCAELQVNCGAEELRQSHLG